MVTGSDAVAFVNDPPIIEIEGSVAIVHYRTGNVSPRAMSIRTLARASERVQKALRRHAAGEENIIVDD